MRWISWLAEDMLASQKVSWSKQLNNVIFPHNLSTSKLHKHHNCLFQRMHMCDIKNSQTCLNKTSPPLPDSLCIFINDNQFLLDHHTMHVLLYTTFQTSIHNFITLIFIANTQHDGWILDDIFINNYTLDECTYRCITYSVTARPKHVGVTNWENIYYLWILLVFTNNYTTVHGIGHIKQASVCVRWLQAMPFHKMSHIHAARMSGVPQSCLLTELHCWL
jgi:hypothetical protein